MNEETYNISEEDSLYFIDSKGQKIADTLNVKEAAQKAEPVVEVVVETSLQPETVLQGSKYKITKQLGQGGFGITYAGVQLNLNRQVAIKEFYMKGYCNRDNSKTVTYTRPDEMGKVESFRQKFLKEARIIADMAHPNIVKIIDVFEENNTAYYVMEHIDGISLQDVVKENGPLSESKAIEIIEQVANALNHVHKHRILHLDVKPANIMLRKDGTAVLIDFGISKHYSESGTQTTISLGGISRGYAPLEQYKEGGVAKFSPSIDIYSLGATLYYLLTGKTPPEATQLAIGEKLQSINNCSNNVNNAIRSSMQANQENRPQSVNDFLAILKAPENKKKWNCLFSKKPLSNQGKLSRRIIFPLVVLIWIVALATKLLCTEWFYEQPSFPHLGYLFMYVILGIIGFWLIYKTNFKKRTKRFVLMFHTILFLILLFFVGHVDLYYKCRYISAAKSQTWIKTNLFKTNTLIVEDEKVYYDYLLQGNGAGKIFDPEGVAIGVWQDETEMLYNQTTRKLVFIDNVLEPTYGILAGQEWCYFKPGDYYNFYIFNNTNFLIPKSLSGPVLIDGMYNVVGKCTKINNYGIRIEVQGSNKIIDKYEIISKDGKEVFCPISTLN